MQNHGNGIEGDEMKIEGKTILVTGGAGFIGSHLVDSLISENPKKIIVVDNMFLGKESNLRDAMNRFDELTLLKEDVADLIVMDEILKRSKTDLVYNLAVLPLPLSLENPKYCNDKNIEMVSTLCELQRLGRFEKLIHFSSSEAYGTARYRPMDEKHPLGPSTPYASSKASGDLLVLSYHRTFKNNCAIIRPFNNYGPRQNEGSYAGIIPLIIHRILNGKPPIIYGDGFQSRDYIYATDTARMAIEMGKNDNLAGAVINIGSGKETNIITLVKTIMKYLNYTGEIIFEPERPGDVKRHIANIYLAKDVLGFEQTVSFEEGMKKTVEWFVENHKEMK